MKFASHSIDKRNAIEPMKAPIARLLACADGLVQDKEKMLGLPTGFLELDRMLQGLRSGELIVVAARPSMGKSAFVQTLAMHAALNQNLPVVYCTLDNNASHLSRRMVTALAQLDWSFHQQTFSDEDKAKFDQACQRLAQSSLFVLDKASISVAELGGELETLMLDIATPALIIIDSCFFVRSGPDNDPSHPEDTTVILRNLKHLAQNLSCPIVVTTNLNRQLEMREDKHPLLIDLDCAARQEADLVLAIYRDDYYFKEFSGNPVMAEIIVMKNRNGPTGSIEISHHRTGRFETKL